MGEMPHNHLGQAPPDTQEWTALLRALLVSRAMEGLPQLWIGG